MCIMLKVHNAQMTELTMFTIAKVHKVNIRQCAQSATAHCTMRRACKCRFTITVIGLSVLCAIHKEHSLKLFQPNVISVTRCSLFIIHWISSVHCSFAQLKHLYNLNICSRMTLTHTHPCVLTT